MLTMSTFGVSTCVLLLILIVTIFKRFLEIFIKKERKYRPRVPREHEVGVAVWYVLKISLVLIIIWVQT